MEETKSLQYLPFTSHVDVGFLHTFTKNKLEVYGLDDNPLPIHGFYCNGDASGLPARMSLDYTAFSDDPEIPPRCFTALGVLHNKNTIDGFKNCDKKELINNLGTKIWEDISSGKAENDPVLLVRYLLLMFADMKKYHYYYWFAFPAALHPDNTLFTQDPVQLDDSPLKSKSSSVIEAFDGYCNPGGKAFFLLKINGEEASVHPLKDFPALHSTGAKIFLGFCDPSTLETNPGWPLRNLLVLAAVRWSHLTKKFDVLCLRDRVRNGKRSIGHSLVLSVELMMNKETYDLPGFVGWERNEREKLGPRKMNLSSSMDPQKLAESSVDLNLKLMKWRLVPTLDLDKITQTKCLLLGSGTLGCNVSRALLGWGIRHITLVDNGNVSFSNPVRQTLFKFTDCLNGGLPKAEAAAAALREIFPGVKSDGVNLSIPMPGHIVIDSDIEQVRQDVERLEVLIESHDVIFLLMDTRESRWLPTVIAAATGKIVINAALGFDTFLVVRHGVKPLDHSGDSAAVMTPSDYVAQGIIPGDMLGCYFCNDVVAPGDSTRDRTLDQQCTVTRPGVSMLAAALAVEIMVSLVHHSSGGQTPAVTSASDEHLSQEPSTILGIVPHQIRGFLSRFYHVLPASTAFDRCTACSNTVLDAYRNQKFEFLLKVFNQPSYLEDLTGLTALHNETQNAELQVWELSDDESDVQ